MSFGSTAVLAQTREQYRNTIITTLYGRRAGMDNQGYECGEYDTRGVIDNIGTTVGTSCSPSGATVFSCTSVSSATHTLLIGQVGVYKLLTQTCSSTLGIVVQFGSAAQLVTTAGTSFNQITFQGQGHVASLFCANASTANGPIWLSSSPPSPGLAFSTY